VQAGGFTAGYKRNTPIFVVLFILLTFSAGVNVIPLDQPDAGGVLEKEDLADRLFPGGPARRPREARPLRQLGPLGLGGEAAGGGAE